MEAGITKVISLRLERELYKELEKQAQKRGESISQYLREILYSYHYPTKEILSRLEENKYKLDYSIDNAQEYFENLMKYSEGLNKSLEDFKRKIEGGAIQFPLKEREVQGER